MSRILPRMRLVSHWQRIEPRKLGRNSLFRSLARSPETRFHPGNYHSGRYCSSSRDGRTIRRISSIAKQTSAKLGRGLTTRLLRYDFTLTIGRFSLPHPRLQFIKRALRAANRYQFISVHARVWICLVL